MTALLLLALFAAAIDALIVYLIGEALGIHLHWLAAYVFLFAFAFGWLVLRFFAGAHTGRLDG